MTLNEAIYKRKSTRKYQPTPLDEEILRDIESYFAQIQPLFPDIKVDFKIVNDENVKNLSMIKAPHYILASSENKDGYYVNIGFMLQQVDLYLSSIGLGSCWLGLASTSEEMEEEKDYIIMLAFGKAVDSPYRELSEFKRKPLDKISDSSDERLEVVRLAPTGLNSQSYYFVNDNGIIHAYCEKVGFIAKKTFTKIREIDIGIAISHLYVANNDSFMFSKVANPKDLKGYYYIGSIEI